MGCPIGRPSLAPFALGAAVVAMLVPTAARAATEPSDRVAPVAFGLGVILVAAKVGGHIAVRLGQVAVLGELTAGVLLGNLPALDATWMAEDPSIDIIARLGALVLLFDVGLELTTKEVFAVGRSAVAVAVLGTLFSFGCGWAAARVTCPSAGAYAHVYLGGALTATSVGITARVLKDLGKTDSRESRVILGAAIVDDVLGLAVLTLLIGSVSAAGAPERPSLARIVPTIGKAAAFFGVALLVGRRTAPALFALVARLRTAGAQVAIGLALCFLHAWAADAIGLAPIVGAFTAGLVLEDAHSARFVARGERPLRELVEPVSSFLVPVFFVVMGLRVELGSLARGTAFGVAAALAAAAVLGKVACALGASGVRRAAVAVGMMPRGEVTLVYASLGGSMALGDKPVLDHSLYSALVFVVIATTLVTPAALKWAFAGGFATAESASEGHSAD